MKYELIKPYKLKNEMRVITNKMKEVSLEENLRLKAFKV